MMEVLYEAGIPELWLRTFKAKFLDLLTPHERASSWTPSLPGRRRILHQKFEGRTRSGKVLSIVFDANFLWD